MHGIALKFHYIAHSLSDRGTRAHIPCLIVPEIEQDNFTQNYKQTKMNS